MNKPKISIIVPVYMTEKYLHRCLDSIMAQTFTDFEAILVDDGSSDKSGVICDEYAQKDNRFRVIHKENGGVSSARNLGISASKGEFIYFADSDDELLPDCLSLLHRSMKNTIDLVSASYHRFQDGEFQPKKISKASHLFGIGDFLDAISTYPNARFCERYSFTKLFRRSIIETNKIQFDINLAYREDVVFLYSYVVSCQHLIAGINNPVYKYYRSSSGAAMTHLQQLTSHSKDIFFAIEKCLNLVKKSGLSKDAEFKLEKEMIHAYYPFRKLVNSDDKNEYNHLLREMNHKLLMYMNKKDYFKMKIKDLLRPSYYYLKSFFFNH